MENVLNLIHVPKKIIIVTKMLNVLDKIKVKKNVFVIMVIMEMVLYVIYYHKILMQFLIIKNINVIEVILILEINV